MLTEVEIYGRKIQVDSELTDLYERVTGKFNGNIAEYLLFFDGIEHQKLSDKELALAVEISIRNDLEIIKEMSSKPMIKKAIDFANMQFNKK